MTIRINGSEKKISAPLSILQLLSELGLCPEHVVVEVNTTILEASQFSHYRLKNNDVLEIVHFVGGG
jgi:thiamine biosynthesis protein ThiS